MFTGILCVGSVLAGFEKVGFLPVVGDVNPTEEAEGIFIPQ